MENTKVTEEYNDFLQENTLATEKTIGWSSICLDQTISYYIECNSSAINDSNDNKSRIDSN